MDTILSEFFPTVIGHMIIMYINNPIYKFQEKVYTGTYSHGIITAILEHKFYTFNMITKRLTARDITDNYVSGYDDNGNIRLYNKNIYVLYLNKIYVFDSALHNTHFIRLNTAQIDVFVIFNNKIFCGSSTESSVMYEIELSGKITQKIILPDTLYSIKIIDGKIYVLLMNNTILECYDGFKKAKAIVLKDYLDEDDIPDKKIAGCDMQIDVVGENIVQNDNLQCNNILNFCIIDSQLYMCGSRGKIYMYDYCLSTTIRTYLIFSTDVNELSIRHFDIVDDKIYFMFGDTSCNINKICVLQIIKKSYI